MNRFTTNQYQTLRGEEAPFKPEALSKVISQQNSAIDDAMDEELEIVRCQNGVGEWEIHPTGETFDTRKEAEARLKEMDQAMGNKDCYTEELTPEGIQLVITGAERITAPSETDKQGKLW